MNRTSLGRFEPFLKYVILSIPIIKSILLILKTLNVTH